MNKNRYLLCLLVCGVMLYYALPKLSVTADGLAGIFSISWLLLCLFVIAGNLSALLYAPKKSKTANKTTSIKSRKKLRQYN
ncbi:hypothetical protein [Robertmurraya kyonggiensis]|uniref:Uncharacterized protein n=1 Tax=Robertmurraya kyonggiensis TaxID=1037680 RepID=A0A4V5P0T9_9BACI|nr:hypothetical protein [Robertmurraya kyonggiensis]TKC15790.1 hypothetical protein FA727_16860 [Robertmurraya kyonggiensis]